jgi:hypothetical protein
MLLVGGADIHLKNKFGKNAIDYAREGEDDEILKIVLSHDKTSDNE